MTKGLLISRLRSRISRLIFSSAGVRAMKRDREGEGVESLYIVEDDKTLVFIPTRNLTSLVIDCRTRVIAVTYDWLQSQLRNSHWHIKEQPFPPRCTLEFEATDYRTKQTIIHQHSQ